MTCFCFHGKSHVLVKTQNLSLVSCFPGRGGNSVAFLSQKFFTTKPFQKRLMTVTTSKNIQTASHLCILIRVLCCVMRKHLLVFECVASEDSDQPVNCHTLIRAFAFCMGLLWNLCYSRRKH